MSDLNKPQTGMNFELVTQPFRTPVIKVIGVGGGGGRAVERMLSDAMPGVEFIAANTDRQALESVQASTVLQLGAATTKGLGAGADPEVGRAAAAEDREKIQRALDGADMVFVTAGMGGGTGTGAAPVVAQIAKGLDILTVAVVTKPFEFEFRDRVAEDGIEELKQQVDSLIAIPNNRLFEVFGEDMRLETAFKAADDVLRGAVQGIADIIIRPGKINVDFADVRTVMSERGLAIMGTGQASGEDRAQQAMDLAIQSPLLDDIDLRGARGVVVNVTTGNDLVGSEVRLIGSTIRELAAQDCTVVLGTAHNPDIGDDMRITVVATGLGGPPELVVDNSANSAAGPMRAGRVGYSDLDQPTIIRRRAAASGGADVGSDSNILNIPKFLDRQAD